MTKVEAEVASQPLQTRSNRALIVTTVGLCLALYGGFDIVRYLTYHSTAYDLAFFDQVTQNVRAGRGFSSTFISYNFLGQHWEPILFLWAQLSRLTPTPIWLLLVNSCALALAPWAAWRLARAWVRQLPYAAITAALITALNPLILRTAGFDYHTEALTPVLALLALEGAHRRRWWQVAACCVALACVKEDALLVVAGIGWLIWCVDDRRAGLLLSAAALVAFVALIAVVMPALRAGATGDLLARYAYLSDRSPASATGVISGLLVHPTRWMGHLTSAATVAGLGVALLPLGLLPLLAGRALLAALPVAAIPFLSDDGFQSALRLHYGVQVFPLLLAAALVAVARLARRRNTRVSSRRTARRVKVAGTVTVAALVATTPLTLNNVELSDLNGLDRRAGVEAVLARIPSQSQVAATTGLVSHVSNRVTVFEFPGGNGVEYVVIDSVTDPSDQAAAAGYFDHVRDLPRAYEVVASESGVTLWRHR